MTVRHMNSSYTTEIGCSCLGLIQLLANLAGAFLQVILQYNPRAQELQTPAMPFQAGMLQGLSDLVSDRILTGLKTISSVQFSKGLKFQHQIESKKDRLSIHDLVRRNNQQRWNFI